MPDCCGYGDPVKLLGLRHSNCLALRLDVSVIFEGAPAEPVYRARYVTGFAQAVQPEEVPGMRAGHGMRAYKTQKANKLLRL